MKTLFLVRHAHAENKSSRTDFFRNLDDEGKAEALKTAEIFKLKKILPQLIISSNAERTMQTARIIADEIHYPAEKILADERLYTADEAQCLEVIHDADNSIDSLMITGHNPTISGFAHALTGNFSENMPTSSCVIIRFDTEKWNTITWRKGKVVDFIKPLVS